MTAALAPRQTPKVKSTRSYRPPVLEVIDRGLDRRRRRLRRASMLLFGLVLCALFMVAFVHARLVESQRELDQINGRITELQNEANRLRSGIEERSAPDYIVGRAEQDFGMTLPGPSVYLRARGTTTDG